MNCQAFVSIVTGATFLPRSSHWVFAKKTPGQYSILDYSHASYSQTRDGYPSPTWELVEKPCAASIRFRDLVQWQSTEVLRKSEDVARFFEQCAGVYKGEEYIRFVHAE